MNTNITNNDYSRQDKLSCIKLKFYFHRHTFSHNASVKFSSSQKELMSKEALKLDYDKSWGNINPGFQENKEITEMGLHNIQVGHLPFGQIYIFAFPMTLTSSTCNSTFNAVLSTIHCCT